MNKSLWAEYAHLQSILDRTTNVRKAAGIEAAMADLLEKIARGEHCTPNQVKNLVVNRISRERRRAAIVHYGRHDLVPHMATNGSVDSRLILEKCEKACGPSDFRLLVNRALGYSYIEISKATGVNQNTLKVRVLRVRQKISHLAA